MSIYDINGQVLHRAHDVSARQLSSAYDISGNKVFGDGFGLKVMQYNVGQWYLGKHDNVPADLDNVYYALQSGIIANHNPDVLLLEEYTAQFSKAGRTTVSWLSQNYPYYHEQTNGTTTTVTQRAIFSKYPISQYTTHGFHGYYYDSCYITINGVDIYFIVTHFHWNNQSYRSEEADIVLADMNTHEFAILGGDLNTGDSYDTSGVDYINVVKKFIDNGYHVANCGDFGFLKTWGETELVGCLDNIITSPSIVIDSVTVDMTKVNDDIDAIIDHVPVVAELTVQ